MAYVIILLTLMLIKIKPYKTGKFHGIPIVKELLNPSVKWIIDLMIRCKGCYVGISAKGSHLYIDNHPSLTIDPNHIEDLKTVLDDVREYADLTEYRLTPERYKEILTYYIK